tara:strand:- start:101 stop:346 length:246 start_codon:yes stop_codon:yes gene_type:complete
MFLGVALASSRKRKEVKILYLVVFVIMNDGSYDVTGMPVNSCPSQAMTEKHYNYHQKLGAFKQWAAICTTINFSDPIKKET